MTRWALRPRDLLAAAVLTAGTQAEVWAGLIPASPRPALAVSYLIGTAALAWHRVLPVTTLAVSLAGLAVVPALLGVDFNAGVSRLVAALVAVVAAGCYAPRPLVALAVTLGLLGVTVVVNHGLPSAGVLVGEVAYAWLLGAGAWTAGRAIASRTLRAQLAEQHAAHTEQEAQWCGFEVHVVLPVPGTEPTSTPPASLAMGEKAP